MTDQATTTVAPEVISFRVNDQEFCIEVLSVREIRGWTPTTPVPNAPSYVLGVVNLRGTVLPVLDLAARLGLPAATPSARHVIIVAWIGERLVGLLVDAVSDIVSVSSGMMQAVPDMANDAVRSVVKGMLTIDDRMTSLIQLDNLLPRTSAQAA